MTSANAEQVIEKALEVVRKSGWTYAVVSEVFQEGGFWIVIVDTIVKRMKIKLDFGGNLVEIREVKPG